jgi:hypothetical protein
MPTASVRSNLLRSDDTARPARIPKGFEASIDFKSGRGCSP